MKGTSDNGVAAAVEAHIESYGAIALVDYLSRAMKAYYRRGGNFGRRGDFVTAPEISQIFGELIGTWCIDYWTRLGTPTRFALVELGPGLGTCMADIERVAQRIPEFITGRTIHFVETSPALRREQQRRIPQATWHDDIATLPCDMPLIIIANEFFDALPIRQYRHTDQGWEEAYIVAGDLDAKLIREFRPTHAPPLPPHLRVIAADDILEFSPNACQITQALAQRLVEQGGIALIIDYGANGGTGDSLQALYQHQRANPFTNIGTTDITAHVNFAHLAWAAKKKGAVSIPPISQGVFLTAMGIDFRTRALIDANPAFADALCGARARLVEPDQMGTLFKVFCLHPPDAPIPVGFA